MMKDKNLIKKTEERENFLESMTTLRHTSLNRVDIRFLIARKWNSWYPSYFQVDGGCYAIVTRKAFKLDKDPGVIVVDPGFRFLKVLREFDIEPIDIKNIVVTHFHPDHVAGLQEFLTLSFKSNHVCNIYLNETSYKVYQNYQTTNAIIHELTLGQIIKLAEYNTRISSECIKLKSYQAFHREVGNRYKSISLKFDIESTFSKDNKRKYKIGILGDTDGSEEYLNKYVDNFKDANMLCLHVGSYSNLKYGSGHGHLYAKGLKKLLKMLYENGFSKSQYIILSEFGLEMGTDEHIIDAIEPLVKNESWKIPLRLAKKIYDEPSIDDEEKRLLIKLLSKCIQKYFLWTWKDTFVYTMNMHPTTYIVTLDQLIEFCLSFVFALLLKADKTIYISNNKDLLNKYKKDVFLKNNEVYDNIKNDINEFEKQTKVINLFEKEIPEPLLLFIIINKFVISPPKNISDAWTWHDEFIRRFPYTSEILSIKNWDDFLYKKLRKIVNFCKNDLNILIENIENITPNSIRLTLLIAISALYKKLGYELPVFRRLLNANSHRDIEERKKEKIDEYMMRYPLYEGSKKSYRFKMYELLQSENPDIQIIPGDVGIQFKLGDHMKIGGKPFTLGGNVSGTKPWLNFDEIKISEWGGRINIMEKGIYTSA